MNSLDPIFVVIIRNVYLDTLAKGRRHRALFLEEFLADIDSFVNSRGIGFCRDRDVDLLDANESTVVLDHVKFRNRFYIININVPFPHSIDQA